MELSPEDKQRIREKLKARTEAQEQPTSQTSSSLTPEDRKRIYEEEKVRLEAREQLEAEAEAEAEIEAAAEKKKADAEKIKNTIGALVMLALIGYFFIWPRVSSTVDSFNAATAPDTALSVVQFEFKAGKYSQSIVGTVKNSSSKQYSYVMVQFNLYDKAGVQVGSALANVNNLEANGTWKFEALVLEKNAETARLKSVSGY